MTNRFLAIGLVFFLNPLYTFAQADSILEPVNVIQLRTARYATMPLTHLDDLYVQSVYLAGDQNKRIHLGVKPYRYDMMDRMTWDDQSFDWSAAPFRHFHLTEADSVMQAAHPEFWPGNHTSRFLRGLHNKIFNSSLIELRESKNNRHERFNISINPILNLELGTEKNAAWRSNFLNTRGLWVNGNIGKFSFYSMVTENQGRFPEVYALKYQRSRNALGWGWARGYRSNGFDFSQAMAEINYAPNNYFNFTLGHSKQFLGEGYRSLILSDNAMPYTFFRLETTIGSLKYINIWSTHLDDTRSAQFGGINYRKHTATHLLSWNITKRWNINVFESIVLGSDTSRATGNWDLQYLNPIIFYRTLEYSTGFTTGNAMLGGGTGYTITKGLRAYAQIFIDDFKMSALREWKDGNWLNLYAWQIGLKYAGVFPRGNYSVTLEHNTVRPFVYSHRSSLTNYAHLNDPLAHPWGSSFREFLIHAQLRYKRIYTELFFNWGEAGFNAQANTGNDLFASYNDRPLGDLGYFIPTGNAVRKGNLKISGGYIINISTGLMFEAGIRLRFEKHLVLNPGPNMPFTWFFAGLRTPLMNRYHDL
jgi:hypothetical protein